MLSGPKLPHIILSHLADKYGPIFSVRLGVHSALIVSSWEIAKECFSSNDIIFCNRPRSTAIKHISYDFAMFAPRKYDPYWRELRKISVQKLLSNRKIETLGPLYVVEIRALMRSLYNSCVGNSDGKAPSLVEMRKFFGALNFKVMVRVVAGNILGNENKGENYEKWHETITEFFRVLDFLK
ncbi:cytochrome [Sesamum alatum]|uniref:Cytochrome n=1 Tax=Sesamum alatum TaxID=300844 RepID=A0AAE1YGE7_9LAMI|nr:cytochrome [Sesamum alatum]